MTSIRFQRGHVKKKLSLLAPSLPPAASVVPSRTAAISDGDRERERMGWTGAKRHYIVRGLDDLSSKKSVNQGARAM